MRRSTVIILSLLLAGCQQQRTEPGHYERISAEIEQLKAESMAAASGSGNIKIAVSMLKTDMDEYFIVEPLWSYVNQNIVIAKRSALTNSGLRVGVSGDDFKIALDIAYGKLRFSEKSELFIVLSDGATGYINIGKEIAVPRFYYFNRWFTSVEYQFVSAGKSLEVTARVQPDGLIDMQLTPVFSEFLNDGGDIELTELTTRISVQPGQSIVLGGGDSSGENVATALLSYEKNNRKKQTLIIVTPHIQ